MRARILALLMVFVMAIGLAACGGTSPAESAEESAADGTEETAAVPAPDLQIGLILAGDGDIAYDANHIESMLAACKKLGLDYKTQVTVKTNVRDDTACSNAIRELAEAGCQIIFAGSFDHESCLISAASSYPDIQFCHAAGYQGATDNLDNTHNYFAQIDQAWYLAGIAAGLKTETGKLGYVAAKPFAQVISGFTAYYQGAKSVNPDVVMLVSYTGQWGAAEGEAAKTQALIDLGCDVVSQHTDTTVPAAIAQRNGVFAVGCNTDMTLEAPDAALVSVRMDWSVYYAYALGCLLSGEAIDQDWCGDYANGACCLTPFNEDIIAPGTEEAIEEAAGRLADGSLQVFSGPLHGVDADGNELTLAPGESYIENENGSAPSFAFIVDGITVLS